MFLNGLLLAFIITVPVKNTCIDRPELHKVFSQILNESDEKQVISGLELLKEKWDSCAVEKDSTYAEIHHTLGRIYWLNDDLEKGITNTQIAISVNAKNSPLVSKRKLCNSYYNLGGLYARKGLVTESLDAFNRAVSVGASYPEKQLLVSYSYKEIASILYSQGNLEKSALAAEKGFQISQKLNNRLLMSQNLIEKAQALIELGSLEEAERTLQTARELKLESDIIRGALNSLFAELRVRQNSFREAVDFHEASFADYSKIHFNYGCGQALANLGFLYTEKLGNRNLALKKYEMALRYFEMPYDRAIVLNEIANVKSAMGFQEDALKLNQNALHLFLPRFQGDDWRVNPQATTLRDVLDKTNLLSVIIRKGNILRRLHEKNTGEAELESALATYMLADTMVDYMRWEHSGRASKLFWRHKTRELYENAIRVCFMLKDHKRAFYFFEKSRAALLQDRLNELGASLLLSTADQQKESQLQDNVQSLRQQLTNAEGDEALKTALRSKLFDAQERLAHFVAAIEKTNPSYYAYKYANRTLTIEQLRNDVLAPGQAYLGYFVGDSAVYGFYCDHNRTELNEADVHTYQNALQSYQLYLGNKSLQNKDFAGFISASNKVFELLVAPFRIAPGVRLVVSPDGKFTPFAALSQSPDKEAYLIRSNPISYAYSASYLAKTVRKKRNWYAMNSFLGMAPVEFDPQLRQASLVGSDKALQTIDKHFVFSKCLEKQQATKGAFLQNIASYPIVQLFTHASADTTKGKNAVPTLFFSDATLDLSELALPFQNATDLLVLSACETGVGIDQRGEGVFSLARGFAEAGIPTTMTTLWNVENEAIYQITDHFYNGLSEGLPLDLALQQAQLRWLTERDKTDQLPHVWAGNVLIGQTAAVSPGWTTYQIWVFNVFLLVAFTVFFLRKRHMQRTTHPSKRDA